jgi:hypothetical protein
LKRLEILVDTKHALTLRFGGGVITTQSFSIRVSNVNSRYLKRLLPSYVPRVVFRQPSYYGTGVEE